MNALWFANVKVTRRDGTKKMHSFCFTSNEVVIGKARDFEQAAIYFMQDFCHDLYVNDDFVMAFEVIEVLPFA